VAVVKFTDMADQKSLAAGGLDALRCSRIMRQIRAGVRNQLALQRRVQIMHGSRNGGAQRHDTRRMPIQQAVGEGGAQRVINPAGNDVRPASQCMLQPGNVDAAALMYMQNGGGPTEHRGAQQVARFGYDPDRINTAQPIRQHAALTHDGTLRPAPFRQRPDQNLGLPAATAKAARQVDVTDFRAHAVWLAPPLRGTILPALPHPCCRYTG